ncbi:hypothetical protein GGTG_12006 [Gaeumannomyces tritici R3-111a-1]|uniref:Uncharacterized protein n=1 Tax=Gaeumannomyces tritici (strain R3-111a-1) TaxID=644352 RepID=J3PES7_GAET3|nr:hypothetical protein GGTG_12006 [Gaeumannomyces tritici R3-111a-1]EJT70985.1 hypothetical protein GGTG_12006 [Gaeumannomyces tritici R3-111a-1]
MDDEIDPHIFFGLQKEHYADKLSYVPKSALIVEVSKSRTGPPSVVATKMNPDELEGWLNKQIKSDREGTTSPGLRLILGNARDPEPPGPWSMPPPAEGGDTTWPGDYRVITNTWPIPFSRSHFDVMIDRFSLPQSTRWLCKTSTRHLQTYRMRPSAPGCPSYGLTFRVFQALHVALSLSHDGATGVTTALMLGQSGRQSEFVRAQVARLARLAHHPALLPAVLLAAMRSSTGGSLVEVARLCGLWVSYTECTIDEAERLREFVARLSRDVEGARAAALAKGYGRQEQDADAAALSYSMAGSDLDEVGFIIDERLDFIIHKARYTLSTARYVRERSMDFMPTMGNYIAQGIYVRMSNLRIRGMKQLRVICLTLLAFLPGILVTTFFSTSFMADLRPPHWAFWAAAVPFVGGVLALWGTWDAWKLPWWMKRSPKLYRLEVARWMGDFKRWARRRIGLSDVSLTTSSSSSTSIVDD